MNKDVYITSKRCRRRRPLRGKCCVSCMSTVQDSICDENVVSEKSFPKMNDICYRPMFPNAKFVAFCGYFFVHSHFPPLFLPSPLLSLLLPSPISATILKDHFYRSFNATFGKIGFMSSDDVVIQLMKTKCLPSLYYGTDVCPVKKSQLQSFEFVISSSFRKIFNIKTQDLVGPSDV